MKTLNKIFVWTLLAAGVSATVFHYFYNRSLWLDEASLGLNIIERSSAELLKPLGYDQVAPILFLQLTELLSWVIGNNEYAYRLIPLLAYLGALVLFYKVLRKLVTNDLAFIAGLSLFVISERLIYYSSDFKQYSSDVFFSLLFLYLVIYDWTSLRKKYLALALVGTLAIFMSNVAVVMLAMVFPMLFADMWMKDDKRQFRYILITGAFLGIVFVMYYLLFIKDHPTKAFMLDFWTNENGFVPTNLTDPGTYAYILTKVSRLLANVSFRGLAFSPFMVPLTVGVSFMLVAVFLWDSAKKRSFLVFLILPLIVHLFLSYLRLYPFEKRLYLYLFPYMMLMITLGLQQVLQATPRITKLSSVLIYVIVIVGAVLLVKQEMPMERNEIKRSIAYVQERVDKNDKIYVHHMGSRSFKFYQENGFVKMGNQIVYGESRVDDRSLYIRDLLGMKGNCWIVFSHPLSLSYAPRPGSNLRQVIVTREDEYIIGELKKAGLSYKDSFTTTGSSAYYYSFPEN